MRQQINALCISHSQLDIPSVGIVKDGLYDPMRKMVIIISMQSVYTHVSEYRTRLMLERFASDGFVRRSLRPEKLAASTTLCAPNILPWDACIKK